MKNFEKKERVEIAPNGVFQLYGDPLEKETEDQMVAYAQMAKSFMNKPFRSPLDIVGNIEWHEEFPYEGYLFGELGTLKRSNRIIDFGCGPGRMIKRVNKLFDWVDGIDISDYAIEWSKQQPEFEGNDFYISSGLDVGRAPENNYNIVFSTISMQHIPSRLIRRNIMRGMFNLLVKDGWITLQMAYHPDYEAGKWSHDTEHATYEADFLGAAATNGHADVVINEPDLPLLKQDIEDIGFSNVEFTHVNVEELYANLNGQSHAPYWARDWLFIRGQKK